MNVQSADVSEEEQAFFTEGGDETEEQTWERKRMSRERQKVDETATQIDAKSENNVDVITNFTQKLRRSNQILLEQTKDPILLQLKMKIQNEEYSEEILQQDIRYKQYLNNLDGIVLKDQVIPREYYNETCKIKYHQILLPKHLLKKLLLALHGTAHKHPGIFKMLHENRQKSHYPGMGRRLRNLCKRQKLWVDARNA